MGNEEYDNESISIPKYAEGDFSLCVSCFLKNQEKMIKEVKNGN